MDYEFMKVSKINSHNTSVWNDFVSSPLEIRETTKKSQFKSFNHSLKHIIDVKRDSNRVVNVHQIN